MSLRSKNIFRYCVIVVVALLFALPLIVMLTTSLRDPAKLFLFTFVAEWNDLFKSLVFTSTRSLRTVQLGLTVFQEQFKVWSIRC